MKDVDHTTPMHENSEYERPGWTVMASGCPRCGWTGDDPMESRGVESSPVAYGGHAQGRGGGGPDPGFVVMEKKRVTRLYCPNCHRPLPESQQPRVGMTSGQSEQSLGRMLTFLMIIAVVGYIVLT